MPPRVETGTSRVPAVTTGGEENLSQLALGVCVCVCV